MARDPSDRTDLSAAVAEVQHVKGLCPKAYVDLRFGTEIPAVAIHRAYRENAAHLVSHSVYQVLKAERTGDLFVVRILEYSGANPKEFELEYVQENYTFSYPSEKQVYDPCKVIPYLLDQDQFMPYFVTSEHPRFRRGYIPSYTEPPVGWGWEAPPRQSVPVTRLHRQPLPKWFSEYSGSAFQDEDLVYSGDDLSPESNDDEPTVFFARDNSGLDPDAAELFRDPGGSKPPPGLDADIAKLLQGVGEDKRPPRPGLIVTDLPGVPSPGRFTDSDTDSDSALDENADTSPRRASRLLPQGIRAGWGYQGMGIRRLPRRPRTPPAPAKPLWTPHPVPTISRRAPNIIMVDREITYDAIYKPHDVVEVTFVNLTEDSTGPPRGPVYSMACGAPVIRSLGCALVRLEPIILAPT